MDALLEHFQPFEIIKWLDQPHEASNGRRPSEIIVEQGDEAVLEMVEGLNLK